MLLRIKCVFVVILFLLYGTFFLSSFSLLTNMSQGTCIKGKEALRCLAVPRVFKGTVRVYACS